MELEQLKQDVREGRVPVDQLVEVIGVLQRQLAEAHRRIAELEKRLGGGGGDAQVRRTVLDEV